MDERLLTVHQAAKMLGVSVYTVKRQLRAGELPGVKIGGQWRVQRVALEAQLGIGESNA